MNIQSFFDTQSNTFSYVVSCQNTGQCAVIDSVKNYDPASGRTDTQCADEVIDYIVDNKLELEWILETHIHADHLSAAPYIKNKLGGKTGIGNQICAVQKIFKTLLAEDDFYTDGRQFDHQFEEGETFHIGKLQACVIHTPGHTPACITFVIEDAIFVGDTLFMPDSGTARCDFPGGDAHTLYQSISKILSLPDDYRVFICHDYGSKERQDVANITTVKEERENNIHVGKHIAEDEFVKMRSERDATLKMPFLMIPSVQVNMRAGAMPPVEKNGVRYIKIPVDVL